MNDLTTTEDAAKREQREMRRRELETTSFSHGAQGGALMNPRNGKELMDMANLVAGSGQMVRDFYRSNPGDCAALIMICQPYGFNPFMVSWKTYKASKNADAPISFEGQLVNAMVNMSAPVKGRLRYDYDGEGPNRRVTVTGIDRETGSEITYTSPRLKDIPTKNSPLWKADPDQQLGYFGARSWARRHFPELLLGVYTREEIEEAPMRDVTPKDGPESAMQRRIREAREAAQRPPQDETPPEDHDEDGVVRDEDDTSEGDTIDGTASDAPDVEGFDAFPGSPQWDEGVKASRAGKKIAACPYDGGQEMADWLGGWEANESEKGDSA